MAEEMKNEKLVALCEKIPEKYWGDLVEIDTVSDGESFRYDKEEEWPGDLIPAGTIVGPSGVHGYKVRPEKKNEFISIFRSEE